MNRANFSTILSRVFLTACAFVTFSAFAQDTEAEWRHYVKEMNDTYFDPTTAPLDSSEVAAFKGINFFDYDPNARLKVKIKKLKRQEAVGFATSTERIAYYRPYALMSFEWEGEKCELTVYRSAKPSPGDEHLFLPFSDLTSGVETYGAGRYMDLELSQFTKRKAVIDFNFSYHPYCAYSHHYSCPIAPDCNRLGVKLLAGVRL